MGTFARGGEQTRVLVSWHFGCNTIELNIKKAFEKYSENCIYAH